jgi:hypothetical protein
VDIPGYKICPSLQRIDVVLAEEDKDTATFAFAPVFVQGSPTSFRWDFGDGSPVEETSDPIIYHAFPRSNPARKFEVKLSTTGPGDCTASGTVHVDGPLAAGDPCPVIKGIKVLSAKEKSDTEFEVQVEALFSGPKPDSFDWKWEGGAGPLSTKGPKATLIFQRPPKDSKCQIWLKTSGPGTCKGEAHTTADIPGAPAEPSMFCKLWKYLVAFLGSLAMGGAIICVAAELLGYGIEAADGLIVGYAVITLLAFLVVLVRWMQMGKSRGCPPTRCDWLALAWSMSLSALTVQFFHVSCLENWIPAALVFFLLLGISAFFWFRDCAYKSKARVFFIYFGVSIITALINILIIMPQVLNC